MQSCELSAHDCCHSMIALWTQQRVHTQIGLRWLSAATEPKKSCRPHESANTAQTSYQVLSNRASLLFESSKTSLRFVASTTCSW